MSMSTREGDISLPRGFWGQTLIICYNLWSLELQTTDITVTLNGGIEPETVFLTHFFPHTYKYLLLLPVSSMTTGSRLPTLNKDFMMWNEEEVVKFLQANKEKYHLRDNVINTLYGYGVAGISFLRLTKEVLLGPSSHYNLGQGPAEIIMALIEKLCRVKKKFGNEMSFQFIFTYGRASRQS
ncbi:hypothetical protein BDZ91DRAFT_808579 [Kalaharituber pfeilii]|nr:hypothetical protein BDZ91DRAFT_808579 [Kalaharituber pfeilii]